MQWHKDNVEILTHSKGLLDITPLVQERISNRGIQDGICYLYIPHTSASLVISENYDPSAKQDLETFLDRIAPQNEPWHAHRLEGADDSPAHIRTMITHTSLTIPIDGGTLSLGRWQGIYLFEHRDRGHRRQVLLRILQVVFFPQRAAPNHPSLWKFVELYHHTIGAFGVNKSIAFASRTFQRPLIDE